MADDETGTQTATQEAEAAQAATDAAATEARGKLAGVMEQAGLKGEGPEDTHAPATPDDTKKTPEGDGKDDADAKDAKSQSDKGKSETDEAGKATPVELTPRQKEAARQLGYSDDEMAKLEPKELEAIERAGMRLRKAHSEAGKQAAEDKKASPDAGTAKGPDAGGDKGSSDAADEQANASKTEPLTGDDWYSDEGLKKINDSIQSNRALTATVQKMAAEIKTLREGDQERQENSFDKDSDAWINGLEQTVFGDKFGKGPSADFAEDSNEHLAREELKDKAAAFTAVAETDGKPITLSQAHDMALTLLHPDKVREQERERISKANRDRSKTPRPSRRKGTPTAATEDSEKIQNVGEAMDKAGLPRGK